MISAGLMSGYPEQERILYINVIRGLACILLVSYHVTGVPTLNISSDHPLHTFAAMMAHVRMPLFAFVSGFVFKSIASNLTQLCEGLKKKVRRLLLPFVTVSTILYIVRVAIRGDEPIPFFLIFIFPYQHLWFLQATMVLMVTLLVIAYMSKWNAKSSALILFGPAIILYLLLEMFGSNHFLVRQYDLFSVTKAFYLAPFFVLGQIFQTCRMENWLTSNPFARSKLTFLTGFIVASLLILQVASSMGAVEINFQGQTLPSLLLSLAVCIFLFSLRWNNQALAWVGERSYEIFLFHMFFIGGSSVVLKKMFPDSSEYIFFGVGLLVGLAGPIAINSLLLRSPTAALLFLGVNIESSRAEPAHVALYPAAAR